VATPGRMIDILTMQSGKILSLQRVSYCVMDEADRMFDMGFAPQISAILSAVRPDRQTVLFSATFPKTVEALARKSLKFPVEVLVGGRSVASDSVTQYGELVEEEDKFLRLLQLLGEHADEERKVIVFVDTQSRADSVFEQLIRCGYPSLSLHGGKEQEDRDSTISDFKRADGPNVLVATSVAGRGLDVSFCGCVINYSAPNHLEDYVHRVGRTGRAGNKGVSYTFCNSGDEEKYAPIVVRAMIEAAQGDNISDDLRKISDNFKLKVENGEARYAGSGFHGKGYSYDSTELNEAQKLARAEKRQALIDAGMIDPDEEDPKLGIGGEENPIIEEESKRSDVFGDTKPTETSNTSNLAGVSVANMSAHLLALPGMKEAIMKKAGYEISDGSVASGDHFREEIEINDYPREARWKVTQKETTSRLQDEFQIAVTLKGKFYDSKSQLPEGERKLYLHVEATTQRILQTGMQEIKRLLNEETLRVGTKGMGGHRYNVL
jgi:ATP-dependent RNA helicase DDX46/PRP5